MLNDKDTKAIAEIINKHTQQVQLPGATMRSAPPVPDAVVLKGKLVSDLALYFEAHANTPGANWHRIPGHADHCFCDKHYLAEFDAPKFVDQCYACRT